ncbi:hypothetical protein D3C87_1561660 [compost metagenome]
MQQAQRVAVRLPLVGQGGVGQRAFGVQGHDSVDMGIAGVDTRQVRGGDVAGAEVAGGDLGAHRHGAKVAKGRGVAHKTGLMRGLIRGLIQRR